MSNPRKGRLFPRSIDEVVKQATKPLMDRQGKLYSALLRDWATIVGPARAKTTRPQKLHWPTKDATGAVLHLSVKSSSAPEMQYETQQIIEQCARYFGYRAIDRIVVHATPTGFDTPVKNAPATATASPSDMMEILQRMRQRVAGDDKSE
jgi:hypothetical protein